MAQFSSILLLACLTTEAASAATFEFRLENLTLEWLNVDLDRNSSKFEEYRDLEEEGRIAELALVLATADSERELAVRGRNLDRRDRRFTIDYRAPGWNFQLDFNQIPHRFGNDALFLFNETRPGRFELADSLQQANQTALINRRGRGPIDFPFLRGLLQPALNAAGRIDIALERERSRARFGLGRLGEVAFRLEAKNEDRQGHRAYGASFGFGNVTELPEPIDYTTRDLEVALDWQGDKGGLIAGVRASSFKNAISTMVWDNPFRSSDGTDPSAYLGPNATSINGAARGFADLAPDNRATTIFLNGTYRPTARSWTTASLARSELRQNDALLPYTLNSAIVGIDFDGRRFNPTDRAELPAATAERAATTTQLNLAGGLRFAEHYKLIGRFEWSDYDNDGERLEFPGYVRYHSVWEEIPRITVPYSYRRQNTSVELERKLGKKSRVALAVARREWDRTFRETKETSEDTFKLSFDAQPKSWLGVQASWQKGDRSLDEYSTEAQEASFLEPEGITNLPGLRKYLQAAREFNDASVQFRLFPVESLEISFGASLRHEDYDQSQFGLVSDEVDNWNAEISYLPGENLRFYVFGHRSERETFQRSRQSGGTPSTSPNDDWSIAFEELTETAGLGLHAVCGHGFTLDLEGRWSKSDGFADFDTDPLGNPRVAFDIGNYEDIELLALEGRLEWRASEKLVLGVGYLYEDFTIDRFILQGLTSYLPGALLLAANEGDYRADVFIARIKIAL